ncbi:Acetyltransferase (GNAT) family protein [Pseudomonas taetrolens]|uniref:Acetyltransferase (GNAT) family protein n=1 Tax=Pseudomonas taetrolens TaxID=47884 RepID=A0A0J6JKA4_PSETA|nr:GNAT family N-acetyltransferase [Pseudomonas taetrolens]KMM84232.1 GCN5 family acetyltransferase [Pseudomonas taetrolens]SEC63721.1 Acetyltransferase (GNAT) family protein [Pseudomonas taetrolens]SQF86945.1 PhnO-like protein [Pseudomonas taetrolens]VEH50022.1 PhnO-like protein [Pseudomonas taetrolens]
MTYTLQHLENEEAFAASFALMRVLRPHLVDPAAYAAQLARQARQGYRLLAAWSAEQVVGLAGYRELENLLYGRFIYVDDLVVSPGLQRSGLGGRLLSAVRDEAVLRGCDHFVLDTGLHMPLAQRFYFRQGLLARGMHFTQSLRQEESA